MKQTARHVGLAAMALCAVWSSACQSSQKHDTHQKQVFHEADDNSDDRLDGAEFTRYFYTISFDHHDVDDNDQLTLVEWVGPPSPDSEHQMLFREMDGDGSGWLVIEEYSSHPTRSITVMNAFQTLDHDGDNYIVLADFTD